MDKEVWDEELLTRLSKFSGKDKYALKKIIKRLRKDLDLENDIKGLMIE